MILYYETTFFGAPKKDMTKEISEIKNDGTNKNLRIPHLILICAGALFLLSGIFQNSIWFDEAYSVSLIKAPFFGMCKTAAEDVHPLLYYIYLKLFSFFPGGIFTLRAASSLPAVISVILGYTHVRRDFGEKTGLFFSLLSFILPFAFKYSTQIRMYTLSSLFFTLALIYAYRFAVYDKAKTKNIILFALFSVAASYTHYFAFAAACFLNLFLIIYLILKIKKDRKSIVFFFVAAIIESLLYIPGIKILLHQIRPSSAAGIKIEWDKVLFDTVAFPFIGDMKEDAAALPNAEYISICVISCILFLCLIAFLTALSLKKKKHASTALACLILYITVIAAALFVSFLKRPIYYERYTVCFISLLIFPASFALGKIKYKALKSGILTILVLVFFARICPMYAQIYSPSNNDMQKHLSANLQSNDIIIFDYITGFNTEVYFPETKKCFYNYRNWDIEDAYKAFRNTKTVREKEEIINFIEENHAERIFVLNKGEAYRLLTGELGYKEKSSVLTEQKYYNYRFEIIILEK